MFTDTIVKKYVVDQFVEEDALVQNAATRKVYRIPREMLPERHRRGACLKYGI